MQREVAFPVPRIVLVDRLFPARFARSTSGNIVLVVAAVLLLAAAAQVRIPLPFTPVPLTGQTFAVLLVGAALGTWRSTLALSLYLVVGVLGLPVFTGWGAGMSHLLGPTGGYLLGFVAAAALLGFLAERGVDRRVVTALPSMVAASGVIYLFGMVGLMALGMGITEALTLGVYPFLLGDALKAGLAALLLPAAWALVRRVEDDRR